MTGSELIAEAERLARPCVLLKGSGSEDRFAGLWGDQGVVPAPPGPYRHWLSFDCKFLPAGLGPSAGCLSVYTDEDDCASGVAVHDSSKQLACTQKVQPLYAHPARSLPPIDAVFRFGPQTVHAWLSEHEWQPDWGFSSNFKDPRPAQEYERLYQSECPLYSGGAFAVLGGWHFPWPDGDWEELLSRPLLAWTFAESEPWVEVWGGADGFHVIQRIT